MESILRQIQFTRFVRDEDETNASFIGEDIEYTPWFVDEGDEKLDEARAVTFGNKANPRNGWMVIMAGGAGSGKGYALSKQILIDGMVVDVDALKMGYARLQAILYKKTGGAQGRIFNFKDPNDVNDLHSIIDAKGWKDKVLDMFIRGKAGNELANIILDITGKNADSIKGFAAIGKSLGYQVSLVWVITNRQWAAVRNQLRSRTVGDVPFHLMHNQIPEVLLNILPDGNECRNIDEAWFLFSGGVGSVSSEEKANSMWDFKKGSQTELGSAVKLKKTSSGFDISPELEKYVLNFLGPREENPKDPQTYLKGDEIVKKLDSFKPTADSRVGKFSGLSVLRKS